MFTSVLDIPQDHYIEEDDLDLIALVDTVHSRHPSAEQMLAASPDLLDIQNRPKGVSKRPFSSDCDGSFAALRFSGLRPLSVIDLQVIHDTEALVAVASARWFANPAAGGSAHYVNDNNFCFRTLRDNQIPWGAPGANFHGLHYEQAGQASWGGVVWSRDHRDTIDRTAWKMARDARKYGIRIKWLDAKALRRGERNGQTSHLQCTLAFGPKGGHSDPGRGYPYAYLHWKQQKFYDQLSHVRRVA